MEKKARQKKRISQQAAATYQDVDSDSEIHEDYTYVGLDGRHSKISVPTAKKRSAGGGVKRESNNKFEFVDEPNDPLFENAANVPPENSAIHTVIYYLQRIDEKLTRMDHRMSVFENQMVPKAPEFDNGKKPEIFRHEQFRKKFRTFVPSVASSPSKTPSSIYSLKKKAVFEEKADKLKMKEKPLPPREDIQMEEQSTSPIPIVKAVTKAEPEDHHDQIESQVEVTVDDPDSDGQQFDENDEIIEEYIAEQGDDSYHQSEPKPVQERSGPFELPCKNEDDVDNLEQEISQNRSTFDGLVDFLVQVGIDAEDYEKFLRNSLKVIFNDEAAAAFNWTGKGGKGKRSAHEMFVIDAIKEAGRKLYEDAERHLTEKTMMRWFRYSEQRIKQKRIANIKRTKTDRDESD